MIKLTATAKQKLKEMLDESEGRRGMIRIFIQGFG